LHCERSATVRGDLLDDVARAHQIVGVVDRDGRAGLEIGAGAPSLSMASVPTVSMALLFRSAVIV
jgi:hypothetical protein